MWTSSKTPALPTSQKEMMLVVNGLALALLLQLVNASPQNTRRHSHRHRHDQDSGSNIMEQIDADRVLEKVDSSDMLAGNRSVPASTDHRVKVLDLAIYQTVQEQKQTSNRTGRRKGGRKGRRKHPESWVGEEHVSRNNSMLTGTGTPYQLMLSISNSSQDVHKKEILKSSRDALIVTRKEYLRSDWCKTQPLIQRVSEDGCISATVLNQFCYGQCNSFFIPKNIKNQKNTSGHAFRSCAFCKPKKTTWVTVTLKCPSRIPAIRRRRVQVIKQCRCIAEVLS